MVGQYMNPTAALPPAQGTPDANHKGWMDYLTHPNTRAALMQAGLTFMFNAGSNMTIGQQVATALGEGGEAAGRQQAYTDTRADKAFDQSNTATQTAIDQGQLDNARQNTAVARDRNTIEREQLDVTRTKNQTEAEDADLNRTLEAERVGGLNAYYGTLGAAATASAGAKEPPGLASQLAKAVEMALFNASDEEGNTYEELYEKYTAPIYARYGVTGGSPTPQSTSQTPAAAGAPGTSPAPGGVLDSKGKPIPQEAIDILKANPDEVTKRFFDQQFGSGKSAEVGVP